MSTPARVMHPQCWRDLQANCKYDETLTALDKSFAASAYEHLESVLGQLALQAEHPLLRFYANLAPWVHLWSTRFARMLSALEKSAGFDSLVNRLRDPDKYDEAASVLECGARLHAARFEVAFDQVSSDKKVPDIAAKYAPTQDILWVEVSRLGESEGEKEESRKFMAIGNAFLASLGRLEHAAKLYKSLAWPRISELVTDIGTAIEQCLRDGRMREVRRAGVAAFAVASVGDAALRDWCRSEDIELNQIIGPQRERDTSRRLRRKIGDELRQLAGTDTGVVVVDLDLSTVMGDKPALVSEVEEFVYERPDLLALVLRTRYLASWSADEERAFGPHRWSRSCHSGVLTDEHFVFLNAYCRGRVAPAVLPRIITAFGR